MRTTFINQLVEEARVHEDIFLLVGDLGFHVVEPFAEAFPDRFVNVGICEQNMAGIAAGLAMNGWTVYCYSIGNFPTLRCIEQIRNDIVYYRSRVRIVSVGAGYAYGSQGVSHQATEEVGMLRTLPGMVVCSPSDPVETRMLVHLSATYDGPMYIRLGKAGEQVFHQQPIADYRLGDPLPLRQSEDADSCVLTSGSILARVMEDVTERALPYDVYTIPVVKPLDADSFCQLARRYQQLVIVEENQRSAGIGSAVIEVLSDAYNEGRLSQYPKVRRVAIADEFLSVAGSQRYLQDAAGLRL